MKPPRPSLFTWRATLLTWRPGNFAQDSMEMLGWLALRGVLQTGVLVVSARALGTSPFGLFVGAQAVIGFFAPIAGLGLYGVVLRDGARDPGALPHTLGVALRMGIAAGVVLAPFAALAVWLSLSSPASLLGAVGVLALGELVAANGVELLARAAQARQRMRAYGALRSGLAGARLLALAGLYSMVGRCGVHVWMLTYGGASLLCLALVLAPRVLLARRGRERRSVLLAAGLPYAAGAFAMRLQEEFNKPLLANIAYADAAIFGVAHRMINLASLPITAMLESLWPRVYAEENPTRRLRSLGTAIFALALAAGLFLAALSPWLPSLFGAGFDASTRPLLWMAWLPAVQVVRNISNLRLVLDGRNARLLFVYAVGAFAGIGFAVLLIPRQGMSGAILAAYLTELTLIVTQEGVRRARRWKRTA